MRERAAQRQLIEFAGNKAGETPALQSCRHALGARASRPPICQKMCMRTPHSSSRREDFDAENGLQARWRHPDFPSMSWEFLQKSRRFSRF
jgi:hypothetical protein